MRSGLRAAIFSKQLTRVGALLAATSLLAACGGTLTKAEADYLYVSTYGAEDDTDRAKVTGGPLWETIPAVKAGEVHELNDDLISGIGIQAAQQILDQFERELG